MRTGDHHWRRSQSARCLLCCATPEGMCWTVAAVLGRFAALPQGSCSHCQIPEGTGWLVCGTSAAAELVQGHQAKSCLDTMLFARQSYHVTAGMLAGPSNSASDICYQHRGAHPSVSRSSLATGPLTPVHSRAVQVSAGSSTSMPPARLKRKKEKSDTISMLREGEQRPCWCVILLPGESRGCCGPCVQYAEIFWTCWSLIDW